MLLALIGYIQLFLIIVLYSFPPKIKLSQSERQSLNYLCHLFATSESGFTGLQDTQDSCLESFN